MLSAYRQMTAQRVDILSDVSEDNFDRAFNLLRPGLSSCVSFDSQSAGLWQLVQCAVIQGTADVNKKLTENEVLETMDFLKNVFELENEH